MKYNYYIICFNFITSFLVVWNICIYNFWKFCNWSKLKKDLFLGGQNDEDVSTAVLALNVNTHLWERKDDMIAGITETTIHSSYAVFNADLDYWVGS